MQSQIKLLSISIICLITSLNNHTLLASDIQHADSLFVQKKYTQAFEIYDSLYNKTGLQSEQMLLKMAFIKEGLNDYTNAIFYLNKYYNLTYEEETLDKISKLAEAHKLKGYKYDDATFFESLLNKYRKELMWTFFGLAFLIFSAGLISYWRKKEFSVSKLTFILIFSLGGYAAVFFPEFRVSGIVTGEALIYELPSSGSKVIEKAEKGRRVQILDEMGVWTVISHGKNEAYVKSSLIRKI